MGLAMDGFTPKQIRGQQLLTSTQISPSLSQKKKRIIILLYPSEDKQALLNIQTPPSVI